MAGGRLLGVLGERSTTTRGCGDDLRRSRLGAAVRISRGRSRRKEERAQQFNPFAGQGRCHLARATFCCRFRPVGSGALQRTVQATCPPPRTGRPSTVGGEGGRETTSVWWWVHSGDGRVAARDVLHGPRPRWRREVFLRSGDCPLLEVG